MRNSAKPTSIKSKSSMPMLTEVTISIVIVSFNTKDYLRTCLRSISTHVLHDGATNGIEVIVVDNASVDGSVAMVRSEFPHVKLILSEQNLGFGKANNLGVTQAQGAYIFLLNSDAYLLNNGPQELLDYLATRPDVACVGPRVLLADETTLQPKAFGYLPTLKTVTMQSLGLSVLFPNLPWAQGVDGVQRSGKIMSVGWLSGVCMLFRKTDFLNVGGFDARFFMYCEDIHLCMKLAAFGQVVLYDDASIVHIGGGSTKDIRARVKNSVMQQQHLCVIMRESIGTFATRLAKCSIALGLLGRCLLALLKWPKCGLSANTLLQTSLARLVKLPAH